MAHQSVQKEVSEPFGLTALEAAHHGNALIISKQSGVGEVLNSIFRYDYWDEDKLAEVILVLLHVMEEANDPPLTPVTFVKFVSLEGLSATGVELYVSKGEL